MASKCIATPLRSAIGQLNRLTIAQDVAPKALTRSITTSTASSDITTSIPPQSLATPATPTPSPFVSQSVLATIYSFPTLEPLRLTPYPSTHLNLPTRRDILHRAVIYEGDMTRLGTASTKWRSEVHGSARKIRPQKGSGKARLGDKKSPMLRGGGVAFGPKPRDFSTKLQRKVYDLAWRTALSYRYRKGELVIVDEALEIEDESPNYLLDVLGIHGWGNSGGRSLFVGSQERENLWNAFGVEGMGRHGRALTVGEVDVKDLLELGRIVVERKALDEIFEAHSSDLGKKRTTNAFVEDKW